MPNSPKRMINAPVSELTMGMSRVAPSTVTPASGKVQGVFKAGLRLLSRPPILAADLSPDTVLQKR